MSLLSEGVRGHEVRIGRSCSGGGAVSRALSELAELIPAVICSVVTTSYVLRAEQAKAYGRGTDGSSHFHPDGAQPAPSPPLGVFSDQLGRLLPSGLAHHPLTDPPAALALAASLALGCSLSWWAHRRRYRDAHQGAVFGAWAAWACCAARGAGLAPDVLVLALTPWALCAAALSSALGHALLRRLHRRVAVPVPLRLPSSGKAGAGARYRNLDRTEKTLMRREAETAELPGSRGSSEAEKKEKETFTA